MLGLVSLIALMLLPTTQSNGKPRFTPIQEATGGVVADGERYTAYRVSPAGTQGRFRVMDQLEHRAYELPAPQCAGHENSTTYPYFEALGGGVMLWSCPSAPFYQKTYLTSTATGPVPMKGSLGGDHNFVSEVGLHWLQGEASGYHWSTEVFVNLETGEVTGDRPSAASARQVLDLDDPNLRRPLCSPMTRRRDRVTLEDIYDAGPTYTTFRYEPPLGVTLGGSYSNRLLLLRCGKRKPHVLSRCTNDYEGCLMPQLSPNVITWSTWGKRARYHAYLLACGRRIAWDQREIDPARTDGRGMITHAGDRLFISPYYESPSHAAYSARMPHPKGCDRTIGRS